jgi:thymidylate synthase
MPSTVIADLEYEPDRRRLIVTFVSGRRYEYLDVPCDVFAAFQSATSKGTFFNARIRDRYRCREIVAGGG